MRSIKIILLSLAFIAIMPVCNAEESDTAIICNIRQLDSILTVEVPKRVKEAERMRESRRIAYELYELRREKGEREQREMIEYMIQMQTERESKLVVIIMLMFALLGIMLAIILVRAKNVNKYI